MKKIALYCVLFMLAFTTCTACVAGSSDAPSSSLSEDSLSSKEDYTANSQNAVLSSSPSISKKPISSSSKAESLQSSDSSSSKLESSQSSISSSSKVESLPRSDSSSSKLESSQSSTSSSSKAELPQNSASSSSNTEPYSSTPVVIPPAEPSISDDSTDPEPTGRDYVLNTNTMKFHYPSCGSAKKIKAHNRADFNGTREELIDRGYDPCGNCHP